MIRYLLLAIAWIAHLFRTPQRPVRPIEDDTTPPVPVPSPACPAERSVLRGLDLAIVANDLDAPDRALVLDVFRAALDAGRSWDEAGEHAIDYAGRLGRQNNRLRAAGPVPLWVRPEQHDLAPIERMALAGRMQARRPSNVVPLFGPHRPGRPPRGPFPGGSAA